MKRMTKDQCKDTGMAIVLLFLVLSITLRRSELVPVALVLQLVVMTIPRLLAPVAVVWLGFSHVLGTVMSKVLLTVIFFVVVTPIGLVRRALGKDPLRLRAFKTGEDSVMRTRNHSFSAADLERPF